VAQITRSSRKCSSLSDDDLKSRFAALKTEVQESLKNADPEEPAYKEELRHALSAVIVPALRWHARRDAAS